MSHRSQLETEPIFSSKAVSDSLAEISSDDVLNILTAGVGVPVYTWAAPAAPSARSAAMSSQCGKRSPFLYLPHLVASFNRQSSESESCPNPTLSSTQKCQATRRRQRATFSLAECVVIVTTTRARFPEYCRAVVTPFARAASTGLWLRPHLKTNRNLRARFPAR